MHRQCRRDAVDAALDASTRRSGWKLVHADVFRPPSFSPMLFSVCIGSGVQLGCMVLLTLTFALFGFLSPANRGSLITALLMLYVFAGGAGGHAAARLYKSFRGTDWMLNTLLTATLVPGFTFACFLVIDISLLSVGSSGAVPVSTLLTLVVLWFGVSVPLVFLGAYVGFKKDVAPNPVRARRPTSVPSLQYDSCPSHDDVGGFFFRGRSVAQVLGHIPCSEHVPGER